jgi:hypothetical protein
MSQDAIEEVIKLFEQLSPGDRQKFIRELEQRQMNSNVGSGRSLLAAFKERGLVGSLKGLPADWSTNSDYPTRFGLSTHVR